MSATKLGPITDLAASHSVYGSKPEAVAEVIEAAHSGAIARAAAT